MNLKIRLIAVLAVSGSLYFGCTNKIFGGSKKPTGGSQISPQEEDANKPRDCVDNYKATRVALVVDNSGSNGKKDGSVQSGAVLMGTDPVRKGKSARELEEPFTDRQNALYDIVLRTADLDKNARIRNASFAGSDLGIAYFPASEANVTDYKILSLIGGKTTVNMKDVAVTEDFKNGLWNALSFTHRPEGSTPYLTALKAGYDLLKKGRAATDTREDTLILITDGLPTDERPSLVRALKDQLTNTRITILAVYKPGADLTSQNAEAAKSLQHAFEKENWARRPGNNDGFSSFQEYWSALLKLPGQIAANQVDVTDSARLTEGINEALKVARTCK